MTDLKSLLAERRAKATEGKWWLYVPRELGRRMQIIAKQADKHFDFPPSIGAPWLRLEPFKVVTEKPLLAYVDLLEKMIEKLTEQRDGYMKNYHAVMHLPSEQRIEIYEDNQAEIRRMLTEEVK